jgi:uncharacterized low-complexity protein
MKNVYSLSTLLSSVLLATASHNSLAEEFVIKPLTSGYQLAANEKANEGTCGAAKDNKSTEGSCGASHTEDDNKKDKAQEGKCGEGKCGGAKKTTKAD